MSQSILIIGFNRPHLLDNCIKSVLAADKESLFRKVLVLQKGDPECEKLAISYKSKFDLVTFVEGANLSTIENISRNRYLGYQLCFKILLSDLVIALEEDVEISVDALAFSLEMHERFKSSKQYRGINFGSSIPREKSKPDTFSLMRYGIMGPASAITSRTWERYNFDKLIRSKNLDWDGAMEPYIKTGFMVTPNLSRYLDLGTQGVHARAGISDSYFKMLQESFVGNLKLNSTDYRIDNTKQDWRRDAILWRKNQDFIFFVRKLILSRRNGLKFLYTYKKLKNLFDRNQ